MSKGQRPSLHDLVGLIYDAGLNPGQWDTAFREIRRYFRLPSGGFYSHEFDRPGISVFLNSDIDDQVVKIYAEHYVLQDPILHYLADKPAGTVCSSNTVINDREWSRSEYVNDFLRLQRGAYYIGKAILAKNQRRIALMTLQRRKSDGAFTPSELKELSLLAPHFSRAFQISNQFALRSAKDAALGALLDSLQFAAFLLDGRGKVVLLNVRAEALLSGRPDLSLRGGELMLADPRAQSQLTRLIRLATQTASGDGLHAGDVVHVEATALAPALMCLVTPMRSRSAAWDFEQRAIRVGLFMAAPEAHLGLSHEVLMKGFGLTRTEATLAECLANGEKPEDIAESLGVRYSTVRTHTRALYDKLGVHRQAQLVRLLHALPPQLNHLS
ncbi:MAG: helix-turn-helix transcriptional regulator [SAR324 cluster bacterium]